MSALIAFAPKAVARKSTGGMAAAILANLGAGGFPVVSIKGKVFHIVRDGDRTLVTKPGEDDPASAIEVVIVGANPNRSRVYYATGFEEGTNAKPDCYSNDGKAPASNAASPQSKSCANCAHSQFGSKVSDSGQKGFACSNSQRIAVVTGDLENDPMLVRIPGASLKAFTEYAREVNRAGYDLDEIVTKVGFDYAVAHPALTFKGIKPLGEDGVEKARNIGKSELVGQIIGTVEVPMESNDEFSSPVAALPKREPKPEPKKADAEELEKVVAKASAKPKAKVVVEEEEAPKKAAKPAVATVEDLGDDLDSLLDGTDFDD
jgi:hypothetical protein